MHVRVRFLAQPETVLMVESKLTKIENFRLLVQSIFDVDPAHQILIYGGKLLEDGYTFHDYNIKLNDVVQLIGRKQPTDQTNQTSEINQSDQENNDLEMSLEDDNAQQTKDVKYQDAVSKLYAVNDLIDARQKLGNWLEGSIIRIVLDPGLHNGASTSFENYTEQISNENLLFIVKLDNYPDEEEVCKVTQIRPRARKVIEIENIKIGQTVMVNYNIEDPGQKGEWFDFKVDVKQKRKKNPNLIGTLYLGAECVPQNNTKVSITDKIFAIEEPVPLSERTENYINTIAVVPPKRSKQKICNKCDDDEKKPCKSCGCSICAGKELPEEILLCDECDAGFHLKCLSPPMTFIPKEDWYCKSCRRDPGDVVAPGAAKQTKKVTRTTKRDWGRGMACVGKTKTSVMPKDHFGPIPGAEVGMMWRFRMQLSETGLHRPSVSGIHGRDAIGAFSIILSGGYEDDVDNGNEFTYTGSGGRDLSGNKRTAEQSSDQKFTRENRALARNCAARPVSAEGADAGDKWREGKPVRVMRSYKMRKMFPKYAPQEGIRYDGIYKIVKYYPGKGISGFCVYKYVLRRDDPSPAPWEPNAKVFSIIYPDGYLEAEAQKLSLKQLKSKRQALTENKSLKRKRDSDNSEDGELKNGVDQGTIKKPRTAFAEVNIEDSRDSNDSEKSILMSIEKTLRPRSKSLPYTPNSSKMIDSIAVKGGSKSIRSVKETYKTEKNARKTKKYQSKLKCQTKLTYSPASTISEEMDSVTIEDTNSSPVSNQIMFNEDEGKEKESVTLTESEQQAIKSDELNTKQWEECVEICKQRSKREFIESVMQIFRCIVCQGLAVYPVTTPCLHNFCLACMTRALKATESKSCPYCRQNLNDFVLTVNENLMNALRTILPGYDAGQN